MEDKQNRSPTFSQQLAKNSLKIDAAFLQKVIDALPVGVWIADASGTLLMNNPKAMSIWQGARWVAPEQFGEYKGWWSATGKRLMAEDWGLYRSVQTGDSFLDDVVDIECFDLTRKTINNCSNVLRDDAGQVCGFVVTNQDVTEMKASEAQLMIAQRELAHFSHALVSLQEKERLNVSQDIHDGVGQALIALKLNLDAASRINRDDKVASILDSAFDLLNSVIQETRSITHNLRPSHLDELGLSATLRWHINHLNSTAPFTIQFSDTLLAVRVQNEVELACFRITQEALSNIAKYAQAEHVSVQLHYHGRLLTLLIEDNGVGFTVASKSKAPLLSGLGLIGMRARAESLGGEFVLHSSLGHGTTIKVVFPVEQKR